MLPTRTGLLMLPMKIKLLILLIKIGLFNIANENWAF